MKKEPIIVVMTVAVLISGCSTRPRAFAPTLHTPPADRLAFENDLAACGRLVSQGHRSGFAEALAVGGTGAAATTTAFLATGAIMWTAPATVGLAALSAVPLIGIGAAFGVSRAVRSGKEKEIRQAMTLCLGEQGHTVATWYRASQESPRQSASGAPAAADPAAASPVDRSHD